MKQPFRTVDGKKLTAQHFAFVPDMANPQTWRLPIHTRAHCEKSLQRIFEVNIPPFHFSEVRRRIADRLAQFNSR